MYLAQFFIVGHPNFYFGWSYLTSVFSGGCTNNRHCRCRWLKGHAIFTIKLILMEKLCDMIIPVKSLMLQFCWCLSQWLQVSKGIHKWKYNCCKKQNALLISYLLFWIKCVNASPTVGFFMSICHCCLSNDDCQKNFKIEVYIAKFCWVWCDAHVCGDTKKQLLLTAMPLLIVSFTGKWITSTWLLE